MLPAVHAPRLGLLVIAVGVLTVACTDTPAPTSKGTAVGAEVEEVGEARAVGETKAGVVPDLVGVTVADSRKALEKAGFKSGEVEGQGLFATPEPNWLVCSQDPAAGQSPPKGTTVDLVADRQC